MERVHRVESQVLAAIAEARLTGIRLDSIKTRKLLSKDQLYLDELANSLSKSFGVDNINSPRQVAIAIQARGHKLPITSAGNKSVSEK